MAQEGFTQFIWIDFCNETDPFELFKVIKNFTLEPPPAAKPFTDRLAQIENGAPQTVNDTCLVHQLMNAFDNYLWNDLHWPVEKLHSKSITFSYFIAVESRLPYPDHHFCPPLSF